MADIEQRKMGKKGQEIKYISNHHYVKKRIKDSDYIGKLDRTKGLIEGVKRSVTAKNPRGIKEYGNVMLFDLILTDMRSCLEDAFKDGWE